MNSFLICLKVEILKTRRTLALILTLIAPSVIVALISGFYLERPDYYPAREGVNAWDQYINMILVYWNLLLIPLFIPLETALIANWEHASQNWKMLYVQPVSRAAVYTAKQVVILLWIAGSTLILMVLTIIGGNLLQYLHPDFGLDAPLPLGALIRLGGLAYLSSMFMMAFHLWVAVNWPSFVTAMGAGIAATIISLFLFGEEFANYFPWSIPAALVIGMPDLSQMVWSISIGMIGGVIVFLTALWNLSRREID